MARCLPLRHAPDQQGHDKVATGPAMSALMGHPWWTSEGRAVRLAFDQLQFPEFLGQQFFDQTLFGGIASVLQHMLEPLDVRLCNKSFELPACRHGIGCNRLSHESPTRINADGNNTRGDRLGSASGQPAPTGIISIIYEMNTSIRTHEDVTARCLRLQ